MLLIINVAKRSSVKSCHNVLCAIENFSSAPFTWSNYHNNNDFDLTYNLRCSTKLRRLERTIICWKFPGLCIWYKQVWFFTFWIYKMSLNFLSFGLFIYPRPFYSLFSWSEACVDFCLPLESQCSCAFHIAISRAKISRLNEIS